MATAERGESAAPGDYLDAPVRAEERAAAVIRQALHAVEAGRMTTFLAKRLRAELDALDLGDPAYHRAFLEEALLSGAAEGLAERRALRVG